MIAPEESCTTPEIVPVVTWAEAKWPLKIRLINSTGKYRDMLLSSPRLKISVVRAPMLPCYRGLQQSRWRSRPEIPAGASSTGVRGREGGRRFPGSTIYHRHAKSECP